MKKLFLIPTALTACVAPTICFVGCTKTKASIFNTYVTLSEDDELYVFDSNNYSDAFKWKGTVEFDFTFNFNVVPEEVLSQQQGKNIMLSSDVKDSYGARFGTDVIYCYQPDKFVFKSITYNGNELPQGDVSSTFDCYFVYIEEHNGAGAGSVGFVLNDFDSSSVLKVKMEATEAISEDFPVYKNKFFATPAIGFVDWH